jgi:tetratricopeptide (TPR) repeat protein
MLPPHALIAIALATTPSLPTNAAAVRDGFQRLQAAMDRDDRAEVERLAPTCLEAARASGDLSLLPEALLMRGEACMSLDQDDRAKGYLLNAMGLAQELDDRRVFANTLNDLGILIEHEGARFMAESYYRQAFAIARTLDDPALLDAVTYDLATSEAERGDYATSRTRLQDLVNRAMQRHDRLAATKAMVKLADVDHAMSQPSEAQETATTALAMAKEVSHLPSRQAAEQLLATLALERGDAGTAETRFKEALATAEASHDGWQLATAHLDLGSFYASRGAADLARGHLMAAERGFRQLGSSSLLEKSRTLLEQIDHGHSL